MKKKNLLKMLKLKRILKFANQPFLFKLLMLFSVMSVVMSILLLYIFNISIKDKEIATLDIFNQMNRQTMEKIDLALNDLSSLTKIPIMQQNSDNNEFLNEIEAFDEQGIVSTKLSRLIEQETVRANMYKPIVNSMFIFNTSGKSDYKFLSESLDTTGLNPSNEWWFKKCLDSVGEPVIVGSFKLPSLTSADKTDYMFSVARGILRITHMKIVGVVLINCNISYIENLCNSMLLYPGQEIVIVDKENTIIYDKDHSNIGSKFDMPFSDQTHRQHSYIEKTKTKDLEYFVTTYTSATSGWKLINFAPTVEVNKSLNQLKTTSILVFTVLMIVLTAFIILFSIRLIKPLKRLVFLMKQFEKGNFNVKIRIGSRDEVGQLSRAFNTMARKVKKLVKEMYLDRLKQKELELQMLQNQINPHFLYNTLESINMLALSKKADDIADMTTSLGKILRYGISRKEEVVQVMDEINNLNDYIFLQKIRFSQVFDIKTDFQKEITDYKVLKLVLQPLVENAINHGLAGIACKGVIKVSGYLDGENIVFEVCDNGKGMEQEQAKILGDYISGKNDHYKGIGLKNVNKRVKLHYGDQYGIDIITAPGKGMTIKLAIPATRSLY